jgi:hypothetical protein
MVGPNVLVRAIGVLVFLFMCPRVVPAVTAGEHIQAAIQHFQAQDFQAAEDSLRKAIALRVSSGTSNEP